MTVCAIMAVASTDIKELLAYSTASHLGLMVAGFGFTSVYGAETGVFHLFNHALFKAALFLVAGIVAHEAGTREIDKLGGLRHDLPVTAVITTVVALSMAGIPPFNGFYSKELLFEGPPSRRATTTISGYWACSIRPSPSSAASSPCSTRCDSSRCSFGDRPEGAGPRSPTARHPARSTRRVGTARRGCQRRPQIAVDAIVQSGLEATAVDPQEMQRRTPDIVLDPGGMSAVTIGVGLVAYPFYGRIHDGVRGVVGATSPIRPNWWYDVIVEGLSDEGRSFAEYVHDGHLRTYASWTLGATCALALTGFVAAGAIAPAEFGLEATVPIALVLLVAVIGAVAVARSDSHIAGVLTPRFSGSWSPSSTSSRARRTSR